MIDFATAKKLVAEQWLPVAAKRVGTTVAVVDGLCVEYEWGWVVHWCPTAPELGDPRFVNEHHFPFIVDRVTGTVGLSGGTFGIERGIVELLQRRAPESLGRYPMGQQH